MTALPGGTALLTGLGLTCVLMVCVWAVSVPLRDASLIDRFWGAGFVLLAWFWYATSPSARGPARLLLPVACTLWGARLSLHLTLRNLGHGEDDRYAEMRAKHGARFSWVSLFSVFLLQAVILWFVALPLFAGTRSGDRPSIVLLGAGVVVWLVGFTIETVADAQLTRHRSDPARRGRVLDTGMWRYSRHPNYFGDAAVWWGHWLMAAAFGGAWTVASPVVMTILLLRVSGVSLLERKLTTTRPDYAAYARRTSAFIPLPPRRQA
jgi:steroid 5-alpha reductase family enzyme